MFPTAHYGFRHSPLDDAVLANLVFLLFNTKDGAGQGAGQWGGLRQDALALRAAGLVEKGARLGGTTRRTAATAATVTPAAT